jgi:hypothetical protein
MQVEDPPSNILSTSDGFEREHGHNTRITVDQSTRLVKGVVALVENFFFLAIDKMQHIRAPKGAWRTVPLYVTVSISSAAGYLRDGLLHDPRSAPAFWPASTQSPDSILRIHCHLGRHPPPNTSLRTTDEFPRSLAEMDSSGFPQRTGPHRTGKKQVEGSNHFVKVFTRFYTNRVWVNKHPGVLDWILPNFPR